MPDATPTAPQLPPASVDFNALDEACRNGLSHAEALDAAVVKETVALSADEARQQAAASVAEAPTLGGLNKAQLLEIAAADREDVAYALDDGGNVIAFGDARNDQMRSAIEAKRRGEPVAPVDPVTDPAA